MKQLILTLLFYIAIAPPASADSGAFGQYKYRYALTPFAANTVLSVMGKRPKLETLNTQLSKRCGEDDYHFLRTEFIRGYFRSTLYEEDGQLLRRHASAITEETIDIPFSSYSCLKVFVATAYLWDLEHMDPGRAHIMEMLGLFEALMSLIDEDDANFQEEATHSAALLMRARASLSNEYQLHLIYYVTSLIKRGYIDQKQFAVLVKK